MSRLQQVKGGMFFETQCTLKKCHYRVLCLAITMTSDVNAEKVSNQKVLHFSTSPN